MPRQPKFSVEVIFDAIKDLNFFDNDEFLMGMGEDVWDEAVKRMKFEMSKKHIYLYISRNDRNILSLLKKDHVVKKNTNRSTSEKDRSYESNWSMDTSGDVLPSLKVLLHISEEAWNSIRPHMVTYGGRDYRVLRPGWTDVLQDAMWKQYKLPCCYTFRNARVNVNDGEMYLNIKGECTECKSKINMYALEPPNEEGLDLHVSCKDTKGIVHSKKRQLRGETRTKVVKELNALSTYTWRRNKANDVMKYGNVDPAHLYSEDVLRKAKQTEADRELGLGKVDDVIASVRELKYRPEFVGTIREIGCDKFFVQYWSLEQIDLYKKWHKHQAHTETGAISLDATGSIVRCIVKPDGSISPMFVYQAVVPFCNKILPIFQMVSEKHDANVITYWIREWLRSGVPCPAEVVTDYSLALLNAVSLAIETIDLNSYVNTCFEFLQGAGKVKEPLCWIRIDIAHLMNLGVRWKCYGKTTASVKEFFLRCLGLLTKSTSFQVFESLLRDVLTVATSKTESINSLNHCFDAQQRLIEVIKTGEDAKVYKIVKRKMKREKKRKAKLQKKRKAKRKALRQATKMDRSNRSEEDADSSVADSDDTKGYTTDTDAPESDNNSDSETSDSETSDSDYVDIDEHKEIHGSIREFLTGIENDINLQSKPGDRQNPYWCPKFAENLLRICALFPLWTNILRPERQPATSARSEEYFRQLKRLVLRGDRNIRVDKFLIKHMRSLSGTEKLAEAAFQRGTSSFVEKVEPEKLDTTIFLNLNSQSNPNSDCTDCTLKVKNDGSESISEVATGHDTFQSEKMDNSVCHEGLKIYNAEETELSSEKIIPTLNENMLFREQGSKHAASNNNVTIEKAEALLSDKNAFLLEEEDWKGKNSAHKGNVSTMTEGREGQNLKRKRGKYLTSCPDIESILKRPKANANLPILKQGHLLGPCRIAGKQLTLQNTCSFDALTQSVLAGYSDHIGYHEYIETSQNALYDFVKTLSNSRLTTQIYSRRAVLLSGAFAAKHDTLDCNCNISNLIANKFLNSEASYKVSQQCQDCEHISSVTHPVVDVNTKPFYEKGMSVLETAISDTISPISSCCVRCGSVKTTSEVTPGPHMFVDIECLQWSRLAKNMGYNNWEGLLTISQIPASFVLCGSRYTLLSVFEYIGDSNPRTIGHYIAYIRRITGRWEIYNDLCTSKKPILASSRTLLQKRKLSMVMYVKQ